jgi:hypothetical protein
MVENPWDEVLDVTYSYNLAAMRSECPEKGTQETVTISPKSVKKQEFPMSWSGTDAPGSGWGGALCVRVVSIELKPEGK